MSMLNSFVFEGVITDIRDTPDGKVFRFRNDFQNNSYFFEGLCHEYTSFELGEKVRGCGWLKNKYNWTYIDCETIEKCCFTGGK